MEWLWNIVRAVLGPLLSLLTPIIKTEIDKAVKALYKLALNTSNPVDDAAVKLLADLIGVDVSGITADAPGAITSAAITRD